VEASQMPYSYQVAGPGIEPGTSWLWTCVFQRLTPLKATSRASDYKAFMAVLVFAKSYVW